MPQAAAERTAVAAFFDVDGTLARSNAVGPFVYFLLAGRSRAGQALALAVYMPLLLACAALDLVSRRLFNLAFYRLYRRIAPELVRRRTGLFAGTDFAYEDLRTEDLGRHCYRLLGDEMVAGEACWRIEATPGDDEERGQTGYARRELLISKTRPIMLEERLFARDGGRLAKTIRFSDWKEVGGFLRPHRVEVENLARGSTTTAIMRSWVVDEKLTRDDFTVFALERGRA
jgi:hypothetical protein